MTITLRPLSSILILSLLAITAHAQKLPNKQETSVYAPANIKIDGQLSEWNDQLQARNAIDGIRYTISNNDENLYLTLVAPYREACRKLLRAGVTFSVSKLTDKKRKDDPLVKAVTFPVINNAQYLALVTNLDEYATYKDNTDKSKKKRDSIVRFVNEKANTLFTTMEIAYKTASMNNSDGIIASAQFDKNMNLVYELSIPLKYLGFNIHYTNPFSYNICLNGDEDEKKGRGRVITHSEMPAPTPPPGFIPPTPDVRFMPTDFWGEYTLAKKP